MKNLNIPNNKIINTIASTTFGILLIHANSDIMREWLWKDTVDCVGSYRTAGIGYPIFACLLIFVACSIIDIIRKIIIEKFVLRYLEIKIMLISQLLKRFIKGILPKCE